MLGSLALRFRFGYMAVNLLLDDNSATADSRWLLHSLHDTVHVAKDRVPCERCLITKSMHAYPKAITTRLLVNLSAQPSQPLELPNSQMPVKLELQARPE